MGEDLIEPTESDIESKVLKFRWPLILLITSLCLVGGGVLVLKSDSLAPHKIEVVSTTASALPTSSSQIMVDISGEVLNPGAYSLSSDARVIDIVQKAGGYTAQANKEWLEKNLNLAQKLRDGQKIYIPDVYEQTQVLSANNIVGGQIDQNGTESGGSNLVNLNSATTKELEELWGIGPAIAQKIVEQRPYSSSEELLTKKLVNKNVYERIKNQVSVN